MADESETVEVPRGHLATYQRGLNVLNKLWDDPEVGMTVKRRAKALDPTIKIPEIDVTEPLIKPLNDKLGTLEAENKKLREDWAADQKARKDREDEDKFVSNFKDVAKRYGLTDDGEKEVAKLMTDRGIGDPEAAAALWSSKQPKPRPVGGGNGFAPASMNLFGTDGGSDDDKVKLLHTKPMAFFDQEVEAILREGSEVG